ncbi:putative phage tail protein [Oceanirhabdus sp. W0125-5]|uniref:putative phage tail protein n=1 Tax=Oceanirhabdus sp. W0125-5 TaxID=2999116 RepID=UPI0022F2CCBD|nr:putative phage tail protein [Oceanirhabdus sp. W0125-5]WBW96042.1 DUF2313 domain-containing protein [Oceanirhabdus sp. W0125-5]
MSEFLNESIDILRELHREFEINQTDIDYILNRFYQYLPEYLVPYIRSNNIEEKKDNLNELQTLMILVFPKVIRELNEIIIGMEKQLCISTAHGEGITQWEEMLGLFHEQDKEENLRKENIRSKLRSSGTATIQLIKDITKSYSKGTSEIIEYPDKFHFDIKFKDDNGVPENINEISKRINEIKPAHLTYAFIYTFVLWAYLKERKWNELLSIKWSECRKKTNIS